MYTIIISTHEMFLRNMVHVQLSFFTRQQGLPALFRQEHLVGSTKRYPIKAFRAERLVLPGSKRKDEPSTG